MTDTIFDKIIRREIPADIVYEDDEMLAFRDVNPQAPVHVLFIPKRRIATLNDLQADDGALVGRLFATAVRWAKDQGFAVGLATALPVSVATIADWARDLEERGFLIVPASALMGE